MRRENDPLNDRCFFGVKCSLYRVVYLHLEAILTQRETDRRAAFAAYMERRRTEFNHLLTEADQPTNPQETGHATQENDAATDRP